MTKELSQIIAQIEPVDPAWLARAADLVVLVVAGLPLVLKGS